MAKKLVVSFPGGRGDEIPLLYFTAKHFEDLGYEKLFIHYPTAEECCFEIFVEKLIENAESKLKEIHFTEYEEVVFIAKSVGTVVACKLKEKHTISASLILFTPLNETLPYINNTNNVHFVAGGERDRFLDSKLLSDLCEKESVKYYIEPNVGHRMEVLNDLNRNLQIVFNVVGRIEN